LVIHFTRPFSAIQIFNPGHVQDPFRRSCKDDGLSRRHDGSLITDLFVYARINQSSSIQSSVTSHWTVWKNWMCWRGL